MTLCGVAKRRRGAPDQGATLVEYALLMALVLGATLAAIDGLTEGSGDYLSRTSDAVGAPRPYYSDMSPVYPDPDLVP